MTEEYRQSQEYQNLAGRDSQEVSVPEVKTGESVRFPALFARVKRIEVMNYVIIFVLCLIIVLQLFSNFNAGTRTESHNTVALTVVDKAEANRIINEIKDYYNSGETEELYYVMGEYARTFITYEDFLNSIAQIKVIGNMERALYTHYEYLQNQDGGDWFILNYIAKYEAGDGDATVTIKVNGNEWEVLGFRFNVNNMR